MDRTRMPGQQRIQDRTDGDTRSRMARSHCHHRRRIRNYVTPEELAKMRYDGEWHSWREIGEWIGFSAASVRKYAQVCLPMDYLGSSKWNLTPPAPFIPESPAAETIEDGQCTECRFFAEARNPILSDGVCLICHLNALLIPPLTVYERWGSLTMMVPLVEEVIR